jgi:hypothetical protein
MSSADFWPRQMNSGRHSHSPRSRRRQRSRPHRSVRLAIEGLEDRELLSVAPVGPEFLVNTFTNHDQSLPSLATDSDGDFIIAWRGFHQDGIPIGIYAQRYSAAGAPQGDEFRVNTFTGPQSSPMVAMDADGDFVIVWESYSPDGSERGVFVRRYDALGVPQGGEFRVNTFRTWSPSVAMDADGDFVVAWVSLYQNSGDIEVYAQRYNAAGVPQGAEFQVNTFTTVSQSMPSVAMDADGDFVIAWTSFGQDGYGFGIYGQSYNAAGVPQGSEFRVNTFTGGQETEPSVAMDADGDFVISWRSTGHYDGASDVYLQRYNAEGVSQGSETRVNTFTAGFQSNPSVAMDASGDFAVAWTSSIQDDDSGSGVFAQRYDAAGIPQGGEFQVNTFIYYDQHHPNVALDADGDLIVAWESLHQVGGADVFARRFGQEAPPTPEIQTIGLYNPDNGDFFLRTDNHSGIADFAFQYGPPGLVPIAGDWNNDGITTIGTYDPASGMFLLRNSNTPGPADINFQFGAGGAGYVPLVGDWDGNGDDTVGLYDPGTGVFFLRNSHASGAADLVFQFGAGGQGYTPLAGDWDAQGGDTVGLYSAGAGVFFLRNAHAAGAADLEFQFGAPETSALPLTGNWDGYGGDTIGLYVRSTGVVFLRNANAAGEADRRFYYGPAGQSWTPIAGDWNGSTPTVSAAANQPAAQNHRATDRATLETLFSEEEDWLL